MRTRACSVLEPLHCCPCLCFPLTKPDDSPNSSWVSLKTRSPTANPTCSVLSSEEKFGAGFTDDVLLLPTFPAGSHQRGFGKRLHFYVE